MYALDAKGDNSWVTSIVGCNRHNHGCPGVVHGKLCACAATATLYAPACTCSFSEASVMAMLSLHIPVCSPRPNGSQRLRDRRSLCGTRLPVRRCVWGMSCDPFPIRHVFAFCTFSKCLAMFAEPSLESLAYTETCLAALGGMPLSLSISEYGSKVQFGAVRPIV
jgi:hypothetical protein